MMGTFGTANMLKSQYMSMFGLNILPDTLQILSRRTFQALSKGAHLHVVNYLLKGHQSPKVLISLCLGNLGHEKQNRPGCNHQGGGAGSSSRSACRRPVPPAVSLLLHYSGLGCEFFLRPPFLLMGE
jgi:hypothetical protein